MTDPCDPLCPFVLTCKSCAFQGSNPVARQGFSGRGEVEFPGVIWDNGDSKTDPGVASTNTGVLALPKL